MTRFEDTVKALSGAIEESRQKDNLKDQETDLLAQKLLKGKLDPGKVKVNLGSVDRELREYRDKLKTFLNSNLQEDISQSLQNAGKTVSLVEKLEQDTNTALDESRDLETLAEHLQSRKIASAADTEKERIKELGRKLQRIDQRSQRVETLVGRLQQMLDDSGIELENLNQEIEKRVKAVNRILEKAGEETGAKNRQERDTLEHNLEIAQDYFKRVYGDGLRETEFLAFNRISQARSYLENNREEMDRLEQGFEEAIRTLEQNPNRARYISIGTEPVTALSIIYIPNGFTEGFFEELFHAMSRIDSKKDEETYVPIATFLGGLWARQQGYLQSNPDRKKLVEDAVGHGSFTRQGYSFPAEQVPDEYKGREVTAKLLERFMRRGMERSEIEGVAVEIYEEIIETDDSAPKIISKYISEEDSKSTEKVDRFAAELLEEEEKLIKAGEKGKESLTRDIRRLEHLYQYRKFEETKLGRIESRLRSGSLKEAKEASEELAEENKQVENQTGFLPESLEKDLEEEIEISKTLYRFFSRVRKLRENGVKPEALFEAMARNSSIDKERALKLFRGLKEDYSDVHEGITKARKLAQREHKIEKNEYDQIRKIEDDSAKIWNRATTSKDRDHLKAIHQNLRTVGFNLDEVNPSQETRGPENSTQAGSKKTGAETNEDNSDGEWEELLKNPGKYIEPGDDLDIDPEGLSPYELKRPQGWTRYPEYHPQHTTPKQGFKFHISASPEEGYKVCKELIPILQASNIDHKIIRSLRYIENNMSNEPLQRKKLITIYPKSSIDPKDQVFEVGNEDRNKRSFMANEPHTREILKKLLKHADRSILDGGPKLEDERQALGTKFDAEEPRVKNTRIHITYSIVSGKNRLRTIIDEDGRKTKDITDYIAKVDNSGRSSRKVPNEKSFRTSNNGSGHFLDHLTFDRKQRKIKIHLAENDPEDAIFGYDAKVCGAHYLIPPEGYDRIEKIISDVFDELSS